MGMDMGMGMGMGMGMDMDMDMGMGMGMDMGMDMGMGMDMDMHGFSLATCSAVGLTCSSASTSVARLSHCASGETPPSGGARCVSEAKNRPGDGAPREVAGPEGASRRSR